jgi:hypothetical protein
MKEIQPQIKDKVVIVGEQEKKHQMEFIGSLKPYKGHTLFKVNKVTGEILEAEFEKLDLKINSLDKQHVNTVHRKVIVEAGFYYVSALNKKNVLKKFIKNLRK